MSTTRHLVNRRRRLDAVGSRPGSRPGPVREGVDGAERTPDAPGRGRPAPPPRRPPAPRPPP
ncbi:hypothetical protein ACFV4M_16295, partial [Kitasatospora indigofera]